MAMNNCNGNHSAVLEPQVEAIQTITTLETTDPRDTRPIYVRDSNHLGPFQKSLNVVFYYNKFSEDSNGWFVAGWIKESLGRALSAQPMLCGRLRRKEDADRGEMEVVSNDSGLRLIEARFPMTLSSFLGAKEREEAEAQLVYWKDIDEKIPEFSPLAYVQVTNFECGGYSIGMSCSILLADLILMTDFLKTWATIHSHIFAKTGESKLPIFYSPKLKPNTISASLITPSPSKKRSQTLKFKIDAENANRSDENLRKKIALLCIEEAKGKLGGKMANSFTFLVKESSGCIRIENSFDEGMTVHSEFSIKKPVVDETWDEIGLSELSFIGEKNRPSRVSWWIGSGPSGTVMAMVNDKGQGEVKIMVAIP